MPTNERMRVLMHLLQLSDSALPVGGFSFSNGLESAVEWGVVRDEQTLMEFVLTAMRIASTTDCVAALIAYRAAARADFQTILKADRELLARKVGGEQRLMSQRMGRKMGELLSSITEDEMLRRWCEAIKEGTTSGTQAVAQALAARACGVGQRELFGSMLYGVAAMMLSAALRLMRLSHLSSQHLLYRLSHSADSLYAEAESMGLVDMYGVAPQMEILASLHEKGQRRMFMN